MPRLDRGEEKPPMSAEARRWWLAPMVLRELGGRSELVPSGVLFRFAAMWLADIVSSSGALVRYVADFGFCPSLVSRRVQPEAEGAGGRTVNWLVVQSS